VILLKHKGKRSDDMYHVGIDIGGTKINIGIVDDDANVVAKRKLYISELPDIVSDIAGNVLHMLGENGIPKASVSSVGAGIPGTVSSDGKRILKAPNLCVSDELALELEGFLGIPVKLLQDSRAAAYGEYSAGAGKCAKTLMCITLGTGIGTGLVIDGRIYGGALGCAGEIGHTPVKKDGRNCGCGKAGCVEKYSAGLGLDLTASELYGNGFKASYLFEMASNGDKKAMDAIDEAVMLLGNVIVGAVNLISPDCLLFSGGLSNVKMYADKIVEYVKSHCYTSDGTIPHIGYATLGEDSPMIGAALYS
jgi:glucokinase